MSKETELIRKLVGRGWYVTLTGEVIKPNGEIRPTYTKKGNPPYKVFSCKDGVVSRPVHVHRLVAYISEGENAFKPGIVVRHLNGDSLDNSRKNITIGSQSQNMMDKPEKDRANQASKAAYAQRKFTEEEITFIRNSEESGNSLAVRFGVAKSTISYIRNKKTYR